MAGSIRVTMEVGADGVALITICNPPVNALHPIIIQGLKEKYAEAMDRDDVKAIVLTGAAGKFCGGFDINVFTKVHETGDVSLMPDVSVELVSNMMEDGKKPSVSAIQGLALGGGLELIMGCHARISTPEAQLGLPELTLGVIPGFGGTQRLPRLVGLPKAIEMMLQSKFITAKEGKERGLIDALCSPDELIKMSRFWALEIANYRKPWIRSLGRTDSLGSLSEARAVLSMARQQAKKVAANMPQHQACLDVVEEGVLYGGHAGVVKEAKVFKELVVSTTSRALVHVFFAQRSTTKVPGVTDVQLKPRKIRKIAVIGGGLMGSGIATALLVSNISVVLKEVNPQFLQRGQKTIAGNLEGFVKRGSLTKDKMSKAISLLKGALDYSDIKDVDMVIEAVIEKVPLKQSIFADIEKICSPHCILATNTSTIDLNIVGEKTNSQDRIIGAHFFSPAHIMPLLEIVRTEKTSPQAILDLITVGKIIKKVPVVVGNCTGFAVNRTFFPYTQGAQLLVSLGIDLFRIDRIISNFGMPMGPFQLQDLAGYGVALAVKDIYAAAFGTRNFDSVLVDLMAETGRQGKSNGKGYYLYEKGARPKPDPSVQNVIDEYRRQAKTMPGGKPVTLSDQDILEMVFFPVVNEACRVMDENVVIRAADLDIASVLGMGFPKYRGGLIFWADTVGDVALVLALVATAAVVAIMKRKPGGGGGGRSRPPKPLPVPGPPGDVDSKYGDALGVALQFFQVQKAGKLVDNQIPWRGDSALTDGKEAKLDLSKGLYDAGDHMKFTFPMAFTATVLAWSVLEYGDQMTAAKQLDPALDALRWVTDFLIAAHPSDNVFYIQVGDPDLDHDCWQRPETMTEKRPLTQINPKNPGSDIAAEAAAALAAASMVFKSSDTTYSDSLLQHAQKLFTFADTYKGIASDTYPKLQKYYNSTGYVDELLWAASWLYHATGDQTYLSYVTVQNGKDYADWGRPTWFSWDDKLPGTQILLSRVNFFGSKEISNAENSGLKMYRDTAEAVICGLLPDSPSATGSRTSGGLVWISGWNSLQHGINAAFLAVVYSDYMLTSQTAAVECSGKYFSPTDIRNFAISQANYVLGDNTMKLSYLVGYGSNYPQQVHHRGASIPADAKTGCKGFEYLHSSSPNPNVAMGAVVGGPFQNDTFVDLRDNAVQTESSTYNSGTFVGLLAGLVTTSSVAKTFT